MSSLSLSPPSHQIAFHVKEFEKSREFQTQQRNWAVYFVPRRSFICEKVLKDEGVYGSLKLHEYHLGLLPFENDVMSLELSDTLRNCDINGDQTSLFYVARSVLDLQSMFGMCPRLYAKGAMGCSVIEVRLFSFLFFFFSNLLTGQSDRRDSFLSFPLFFLFKLMTRLRTEEHAIGGGRAEEEEMRPEIDAVVFLDRSVDLISPMCTPLTYEALIDEILGIEHTYDDMHSSSCYVEIVQL